ncbi:hypothetical protein JL475_33640 [Streptomyces sp. M2CJ-2]|uniref:hypothetical protein n=1 Tax=Streptomyces sp. M2CJ-2 TaxID=2803948 RepID=UPI001928705F|nr:hypothetical protein [Streptomyces sp. M2CJ-2]MBL3670817.1 hypothetical protein [Streptomyces sp. M2CJ-2]
MATLGYASLPVPGGGQSPTVPADMAALAEAIDRHLVHYVANKAERDSRFASAPVHTIVSAADGTVWKKTAAGNTWATWWEPAPGWDRTVTLKPAFQAGDVSLGLMLLDGGRRVELKGRVERVDSTNITDPNAVNLGSVPADCIPPSLRTWAGTCSMAGETTDGAGRLEILGTNTSSGYGVAGDILWWYQGTGGTPWVDISGYYWRI